MNSSRPHESEMELELQKAWLREASSAAYNETDAEAICKFLKQLWESEHADVQLKMLVRCCSENLEKQYPGKFCFAFLDAAKPEPDVVAAQKISVAPEKDAGEAAAARSAKESQCVSCGLRLSAAANFCSRCGEEVKVAQQFFAVTCRNCGSILQKSENFCSRCGVLANPKPAGLIKRGCAILVDLAAMGFFVTVCAYILGWLMLLLSFAGVLEHLGRSGVFIHPALAYPAALFLLSGLYYLLMEKGLKIGSPGKKLLGLRLVSCEKQPMTIKRVVVRHVVRFLEVLAVFSVPFACGMWSWGYGGTGMLYPHEIGFILTAVDLIFLVSIVSLLVREKKFFHDSLSNTLVIES